MFYTTMHTHIDPSTRTVSQTSTPKAKITSRRSPPLPTRPPKQPQAALFGQILDKTLAICKHPPLNDSTKGLALSAKLLQLNPEIYTIWNYRRRTLQPIIDAGGDPAVAAITEELSLTEQALMKNPKSYSTWHYRRWLISSGFCSLEREMGLVESLLLADDRNFHGWGYRQYIARRMGLPLDRELEFSRQKIEQNFSNYSAWHYRTALLPLKYSSGGGGGGNSEEGEGVVVVEKEGTNSNTVVNDLRREGPDLRRRQPQRLPRPCKTAKRREKHPVKPRNAVKAAL